MKRADDFRSFMSSLRTLDESIIALPDIPSDEGLDYLEKVANDVPIAEDLFDKSAIRPDGLKIWDSVYLPMPKAVSLEPKARRDLSTLRSINACWEKTKDALNMLGRPDGVHYFRPKGKFILDLMNDDIRMLQGAHIMTHRMPVECKADDYTFGQTADLFLRNLIKLFLAREFRLTLNVHPEVFAEDAFSKYGIEVFGSTDTRAPILMAAVSGESCRLVRDKTVVTVLGAVGVEAHPKNAPDGTAWRETDKWACLPTLVTLAGWECVDYVTHAERTELGGETFYAVPCSDLQGMDDFFEAYKSGVYGRGLSFTGGTVYEIPSWFESDDFKDGLSKTPQLPCPMCIRVNGNAVGVVKRPRSRKPRRSFKEIENTSVPELKEWADYVRFMRNCITIGRTATSYALGSVTTMKKRNAEYKSLAEVRRRIFGLEERYSRKLSQGYLSEAEAIASEIKELKEKLK